VHLQINDSGLEYGAGQLQNSGDILVPDQDLEKRSMG